MKNDNNSKTQSKIMIGLFSLLGVLMVTTLVTDNFTSKGTYSMVASYTEVNESTANHLSGIGYDCTKTTQDTKWICTCNKTEGCGSYAPYGKQYTVGNESAKATQESLGFTCVEESQDSKWNCTCSSPKVVTDSGCVSSETPTVNDTPKPSPSNSASPGANPSPSATATNGSPTPATKLCWCKDNDDCQWSATNPTTGNMANNEWVVSAASNCSGTGNPVTPTPTSATQAGCYACSGSPAVQYRAAGQSLAGCNPSRLSDNNWEVKNGQCVSKSGQTTSNQCYYCLIRGVKYNVWTVDSGAARSYFEGKGYTASDISGCSLDSATTYANCKDNSPGVSTPTPTPTTPPGGGGGGGTNPTPTAEVKVCYVCVSGEKIQYIKASSSANAAAAASELGTITAANCATTSEANCDGTAVSNCYECNGTKKYVTADSDAAAKARSGGTSCTIVTSDKCSGSTPTPETPSSNPKTGTTGIIIAWIVALMTIVYAMWYYRKSSSLS